MRRVLGSQGQLFRVRPRLSRLRPMHLKPGLRYETTEAAASKPFRLDEGPRNPAVKIINQGISVESGPRSKRNYLPGLWLRDNCRCMECVNQDTMQRNVETFKIPPTITPKDVRWQRDHEGGLRVTWPDGHESQYPWRFISNYLDHDYQELDDPKPIFFDGKIAENPPSVDYNRVMLPDDSGVAELLEKIKRHGFAFVDNTPYEDPQDTKRLLERISFIRETHYGGFYDFTPDLSMADTAYTNIALPAHTDTTYFTDPAGLQSFHLLSHTPAPGSAAAPDGESGSEGPQGGASLLVDGFAVADDLKRNHPHLYKILAKVRLPWHASGNKGITIAPDKRYPVLELDQDTGELHRIRWNNDDRGVVPWDDEYSPEQWYEAARVWDATLRSHFQCWIQLEPGRVLIFDNWRVLHGRSAFTGIRRICGAYINRDDYISRWRNTNLEPWEVRKIIG
ncbi:Trimethyllysine dioxygenase [Coniochaeta hoffmannii]|uniref:Trimethyllysine dioxygenase n=1 Tax=Coniochaeta hoffmannii TaxID=91930 RepID=A0AA38RMP0_9PEZI|nr:Trimethyllysine dioxygenase [Coniochaeta hoffmannii]